MRHRKLSPAFLLVLTLATAVFDSAEATPVTFFANDMSFDVIPAGGSLSGSFQFDPTTMSVSNVAITTTPGVAANGFFSGPMTGASYTSGSIGPALCTILSCNPPPAPGMFQLLFTGVSSGGELRGLAFNIFDIDQTPFALPIFLGLEDQDGSVGPGRFVAGSNFFPNPSVQPRFQLIPEPSSLGMLVLGLFGIVWIHRRTLRISRIS